MKSSDRHSFEVSFLFHPIVTGPGALVKKADGTFRNPRVEDAYQGFKMGVEACQGQLERYSPDRPLPIGLMNQLKRECSNCDLEEQVVRTVLKVIGGSPA